MSQLAVNTHAVFETRNESFATRLQSLVPSREARILALILCLLQVLDGVLTGIGMAQMGTHMEGNLVLRYMMEQWGYVTALVSVKGLAIFVVIILAHLSIIVTWLTMAMRAMIALYMLAAIIPWSAILLTNLV